MSFVIYWKLIKLRTPCLQAWEFQKEAQKIMDFGYAQGIVFMLSMLKECNEEFGNTIYKALYLDNPKESNIDTMVKRLMKYK